MSTKHLTDYTLFCPFQKQQTFDVLNVSSLEAITDPHPLCLLAAEELQLHLKDQQSWNHNFGLTAGSEGAIIGKMFGILVVKTNEGELGYLSAFSGKLAGSNHHPRFVPPVFDTLKTGDFLNLGMLELSQMSKNIAVLQLNEENCRHEIAVLKAKRKARSNTLQQQIFEQYHFLNSKGESKSLNELFEKAGYRQPPAGAGECAGPKLLQYAFQKKMKALAMAEFWWGQSPKSTGWKHGEFYAPCREKCVPILAHMLS
ncbi:hypothetical protein [Pedobacter sp. GR22-6]|uniref:hypothetical protein n=1 Tax=Pedobacter sp. GR22-6 TaxID=3127957 RepID=UPI00307E438C